MEIRMEDVGAYFDDVEALEAEVKALRGVVQAVREHHYDDAGSCVSCVDEFDNPHAWPCPTASVLTPASSGRSGTELAWINDEIGYRCPVCALFVCISRREVAYCPARHGAAAADAPQPDQGAQR